MEKPYLTRHVKDVVPVPWPCGSSANVFTYKDGPAANVHVTHIQDSRKHYHKDVTEIYYILDGEGSIELNGKQRSVKPGTAILIPPGVRHRTLGKIRLLNIPIPPFDAADELFD